jgi:hypothetical protein
MQMRGQLHASASPGTRWIGGWMCPGEGLDPVERRTVLSLSGIETWPSTTVCCTTDLDTHVCTCTCLIMTRVADYYAEPF